MSKVGEKLYKTLRNYTHYEKGGMKHEYYKL